MEKAFQKIKKSRVPFRLARGRTFPENVQALLALLLYPKNQKKSRGFGKNVENTETDNPNRDICRHNHGGAVSDKYV